MRLFTHAESGQLTYTPLSLDTAKHSRYILSTSLYTKRKTPPPPCGWVMVPPRLWLWGCGGALLVSDAADFLWFLVVPPPPPMVPPPCGVGNGGVVVVVVVVVVVEVVVVVVIW